jgi:hypothetical protein
MSLLLPLTMLLGIADAGEVKISAVSSSTTLAGDGTVSYAETNIQDHKQSTVWVEGDEAGSGLGDWVEVQFEGEIQLTSFRIWNGNYYSYDFWNRHNRIKELEVLFSDGTSQKFTLADQMVPELVTLDKPVKTSSAQLRIKGIYGGTTFNDTVISEIVFFDARDDGRYPAKGYTTSSTYEADADGSYEPTNLHDGAVDSLWCEGVADGDGTGEWIEFDLGGAKPISKLHLVNGNAYNIMYFMKSNRATELKLDFSDGSSQTVTVKGSPSPQTIELSPVTASSVKVSFTAVQAGKEFNDLCMAEMVFGN